MGSHATLEPVPGGAYRVSVRDGVEAVGEFLEIDPPHRLVFTLGWTHGHAVAPGSTRVVVTLQEEDGGTRVVLRHHDLPTQEYVDLHLSGWQLYLGRLRTRLQDGQPAVRVARPGRADLRRFPGYSGVGSVPGAYRTCRDGPDGERPGRAGYRLPVLQHRLCVRSLGGGAGQVESSRPAAGPDSQVRPRRTALALGGGRVLGGSARTLSSIRAAGAVPHRV